MNTKWAVPMLQARRSQLAFRFMRTLLAMTTFCGAVFSASGEDCSMFERDWIGKPFSSQFAELDRFTVLPNFEEKDLVACHAERQVQWWGHLRVFKHQGDKIEWAAEFPKEYIEVRGHYVVTYRWTELGVTGNKVLEVFESTHMGNGSLFLLELEGRKFRVLLHAPARGRCWSDDPELGIPPHGEARFLGDHLEVAYPVMSGDTFPSVALSGTVSVTDISGKEVAVKPYSRTYRWDAEERIFRAPASPELPEATEEGK